MSASDWNDARRAAASRRMSEAWANGRLQSRQFRGGSALKTCSLLSRAIQVVVPIEMAEELKARIKTKNLSMSALVREYIEWGLENDKTTD